MFGMGMGEIVLIAVVALLVLGPERLPGAAKAIGKGIRDLRQQSKDLQQTIEKDTQIGDAVRELRTALRGDPESLYKAATGEEFSRPELEDKDPATAASAAEASPAEASPEEIAAAGAEAESGAEAAEAAAAPADDLAEDVIDKAYANTDDGWGKPASNPHDEEPAGGDDAPLIRTPAGATARDSESQGDDSSHG